MGSGEGLLREHSVGQKSQDDDLLWVDDDIWVSEVDDEAQPRPTDPDYQSFWAEQDASRRYRRELPSHDRGSSKPSTSRRSQRPRATKEPRQRQGSKNRSVVWSVFSQTALGAALVVVAGSVWWLQSNQIPADASLAGARVPSASSTSSSTTPIAPLPHLPEGNVVFPASIGQAELLAVKASTPVEPITLAFAGDINGEGLSKTDSAAAMAGRLAPMKDLLSSADITVANLETALTERGDREPKQFTFRSPAGVLDGLKESGIDVVSMANNHGLDFGTVGLEDSIAAKRAAPIPVVGIGQNEDEAFAPARITVKGRTVAIIGATQVLDASMLERWTAGPTQAGLASAKRVDRLLEEVRRAKAQGDIVVVFLHWGTETHTCPNPAQEELAQQLSDAGVDLAVGGHAHRVLGGGYLGKTLVHFGLGNFGFASRSAASANTGVLTVTVGANGVTDHQWHPGRIEGSTPAPLQGEAAAKASAAWDELRSCTNLSATPN